MKERCGNLNIYEIRASDGTVKDRGTARELSRRYYYTLETIEHYAKVGRTINGGYSVVFVGKEWRLDNLCEQIIDLRGRGLTYREIANELGVSYSAVRNKAHRLRRKGFIHDKYSSN